MIRFTRASSIYLPLLSVRVTYFSISCGFVFVSPVLLLIPLIQFPHDPLIMPLLLSLSGIRLLLHEA